MTDDEIAELLANRARRSELIVAAYETTKPQGRRDAALAHWRCQQHGCTLLAVWQSPFGIAYYQPGYRTSPGWTAASSTESGRQKNTVDGDRRWKPTGGILDPMRGAGTELGMSLECEHIPPRALSSEEIFEIVDATTPGRPKVIIV